MEKKHKELQLWARLWRWAKTLFFVLTMLASLLLVCAPPLFVVVLDLLLPTSFLSSYFRSSSRLSATRLADQFRDFHFRSSLVDVPLVSAARSLVILCAYAACGGRGVYLGITTLCSFTSACYVLVKSIVMLGVASGEWGRRHRDFGEKGGAAAVEALFLSSLALAVAHLVVAYRTSCRERRKLLVYRIDIEAVKLKGVQTKGVK
ncbi:uncharacterized protein LOC109713771 [Ananas comosus]|uniref:Uncharacterized protein LOC109713771 n=1 Tax=Ananas comosus TaxID=4615 RepID=A0A6P5FK63_ANACO|nr:uncharacterized protein LOC109713771 [Ananas comosus]